MCALQTNLSWNSQVFNKIFLKIVWLYSSSWHWILDPSTSASWCWDYGYEPPFPASPVPFLQFESGPTREIDNAPWRYLQMAMMAPCDNHRTYVFQICSPKLWKAVWFPRFWIWPVLSPTDTELLVVFLEFGRWHHLEAQWPEAVGMSYWLTWELTMTSNLKWPCLCS